MKDYQLLESYLRHFKTKLDPEEIMATKMIFEQIEMDDFAGFAMTKYVLNQIGNTQIDRKDWIKYYYVHAKIMELMNRLRKIKAFW